MNILFTCHRLPYPPKRGGKIRPFNIIKHFHSQGHAVTVGTLSRSAEELKEGQGLRDYCDQLHVGSIGKFSAVSHMLARLPSARPSSFGYFYSRSLHKKMRKEIRNRKFDLVFTHCSSAAQYVTRQNGIPSILDFGDMDSCKWRDYSKFKSQPWAAGYALEAAKLEREEKRLARIFEMCTCTTRAEHETLIGMNAAKSTSWFPNGVDAEYFCPDGADYDSNSICFVGRMDYYPNQQGVLSFCRSVLPLVQRDRPSATFTIVGASPSEEVLSLATLPGVTVTGTVPDVRPYVRNAALTVAPLAIARGTQNKILESMAMGVPVVSSSAAAGGVDAVPGEHILVADSDEAFSKCVLSLLNEPDKRQSLANLGRDRVIANHDWQSSLRRLDSMVATVCGGEGLK